MWPRALALTRCLIVNEPIFSRTVALQAVISWRRDWRRPRLPSRRWIKRMTATHIARPGSEAIACPAAAAALLARGHALMHAHPADALLMRWMEQQSVAYAWPCGPGSFQRTGLRDVHAAGQVLPRRASGVFVGARAERPRRRKRSGGTEVEI
ncbi:hypothetical protein BC834DRAFT_386829 [Gloeopeniophorella convolvens]|nr:hypothetical protein BC834DRAFT_386829 [Gloeopeniophorella convolvens]